MITNKFVNDITLNRICRLALGFARLQLKRLDVHKPHEQKKPSVAYMYTKIPFV